MGNTSMVDPHRVSSEDRARIRAEIDALNAEAAANWDNPTWRAEAAAALTETIYLGFEHENLLSLMTNVENVDFNGRSFLREAKGLRAFWVARGGYIEASTIRVDALEIPRDTIGFHVYEFEDALRTNFAETQATLVDLGIKRLDAEVNLRFLRGLQAAVPIGSLQYVSGSGISLTALNQAIREVKDETMDGEVVILGRSTMVGQIGDQLLAQGGGQGIFAPETNEQLLRLGVLGTYKGARIVEIRNFRDDMDIPFFPGNEMWVIARDASKFAFFGTMLSKEFTENDAWYWHYLARRDFGGVVHRPGRLRRFIDTAIQPFVVVEQ